MSTPPSFTAAHSRSAAGIWRSLVVISALVALVACKAVPPTADNPVAEASAASGSSPQVEAPVQGDTSSQPAAQPDEGTTESVPDTAEVAIEAPLTEAERAQLVTLSGAVTEVIAGLGYAQQIVGVDSSSVHPPEMTSRSQVGYHRRLSAEGVLALQPSAIVGTPEDGPDAAITAFRSAGIRYVAVPHAESVDTAIQRIRELGRLLEQPARAEEMVTALQNDLARVAATIPADVARPKVLFIYARGPGVLMVAGRNTPAEQMISLAGGVNAVTEFDDFRPLTPEAVVAAAPDVLLMAQRGAESVGGNDAVFGLPGVALTPAGQNQRLITVDDLQLLGFGPRMGQAVTTLAQGLHPELPWSANP